MIDDIIKDTVKKMAGAIDFARQDFATVRTGRANPAMFNKLEAEYYGTPTPLQQLATFQSPEPRVMLISPFDASALNAIEKAIRNSDLGVNPASDGKAIRVVLPELTEERRKEYIKIVRAKAEEGRVAVRNIRRHAVDQVKKAEKDKAIGEDEAKRAEKRLDDETKKSVDTIDQLLKAKETELMAV
ncbi:ribosome recycling factor [Brooklawnia propionicigenes]|uniref:Ribosome-recycling factor n=1 Tax=Brooklawnia propionicigenes TaxID=3041175 RepID=A0AAN0K8L8_9ACTN|nr:ribosome recycling factor [Brooklawnia sp. SH051]